MNNYFKILREICGILGNVGEMNYRSLVQIKAIDKTSEGRGATILR